VITSKAILTYGHNRQYTELVINARIVYIMISVSDVLEMLQLYMT